MKLEWDKTGERLYETGTKNCALYPFEGTVIDKFTGDGTNKAFALSYQPVEGTTTVKVAGESETGFTVADGTITFTEAPAASAAIVVTYKYDNYGKGVAWNGITAISESPSGAEETALWADDIKYLSLRSKEEFGGTIEAYTYPDAWAECDGSAYVVPGVKIGQQTRKKFGLCYRTALGNDVENEDYGYLLHLVYGAQASPSERSYATMNDSPEAITFSWEFTTVPEKFGDGDEYKPSATVTIDSTKIDAAKLEDLEEVLYGTENTDPRLPLPSELLELLA